MPDPMQTTPGQVPVSGQQQAQPTTPATGGASQVDPRAAQQAQTQPGALDGDTSQADDTTQPSNWTLDQALRELTKVRREAADHRTARRALEAAAQEAERAKMTREEQLAASLADRERELNERTTAYQERALSYEVQVQAAKLGIIDPDAAAKLLDRSQIEYTDDGTPKNLGKLLTALAKDKPYLVKPQASVSATNAPSSDNRTATFTESQIAAMSPAEYKQHKATIYQAMREGRILPG